MALLTNEEAVKFLKDILDITSSEIPDLSDTSTSANTKLSFLNKLIQTFLEREPFQSLCLMSQDVDKRRRPTWDEIKRDLLSGRGGLCYWLNAFMHAVLLALGFDSSLTYSTYNVGIYSPNNHVVVLLRNILTPGSLHLIDVGLGYYIPRAVSLDFVLESEEFTDSFMTYKFQRESESHLYLMKKVEQDAGTVSSANNEELKKKKWQDLETGEGDEKSVQNISQVTNQVTGEQQKDVKQCTIDSKGNLQNGTSQSQTSIENNQQPDAEIKHATVNGKQSNEDSQLVTWQKLYVINPTVMHQKLEAFFDCFDQCFTNVTRLSTHSSPRAMHWPGGRFLALVNSNLIQEVEPGKLTKTRIVDVDVVRRKPPVASISDSNLETPEHESTQNSCENTLHNSHNETIASGIKNSCSNSKTSEHKTQEISETTHRQNSANGNRIIGLETSENTDDQRQIELSELDPLVEAYARYFPLFSTQMVKASLKNWIATGTIFPVPKHLA